MPLSLDSFRSGVSGVSDAIGDAKSSLKSLFGEGSGDLKPIVRSSDAVTETHALDNQLLDKKLPLLSYQYYVKVNYNTDLKDFLDGVYYGLPYNTANAFIQKVKLPSFDIETQVLREMNRRRVVHKSISYSPVELTFLDTNALESVLLWQAYFQYYYKEANPYIDEYVKDRWVNSPASFHRDHGYNTVQVDNKKQLIKNIEIYQISAGLFRKTTLHNPSIVSFSQDTLGYDTNEIVKVSYEFEYEWADITDTDKDGVANEMQFTDDEELKEFFSRGDIIEYDFLGTTSSLAKPQSTLEQLIDTAKEVKDAVDDAKDLVRDVAGRVSQISSIANQIQMDITGKDEPIVEFPDGRKLGAVADKVPTSWSDVTRVIRDGGI